MHLLSAPLSCHTASSQSSLSRWPHPPSRGPHLCQRPTGWGEKCHMWPESNKHIVRAERSDKVQRVTIRVSIKSYGSGTSCCQGSETFFSGVSERTVNSTHNTVKYPPRRGRLNLNAIKAMAISNPFFITLFTLIHFLLVGHWILKI